MDHVKLHHLINLNLKLRNFLQASKIQQYKV